MAKSFEAFVLRELVKTYDDCANEVKGLRRAWIIASVIGWSLVLTAYFLSEFQVLAGPLCAVIGAVGAFVEGWSFMYLLGAEQLPISMRYTTIDREAIQKRLEELKGG